MNCPFKKKHSHNTSRLLSMIAVILLFATMLSACQKKPAETEPSDSITPPNLVETPATTAPPETTAPTEPEKDNVAIVKEQVNVRSSPSTESNVISQLDAGEEVEINRIESINGIQWAYIPLKGWVTTDNLDMTNVTGIADPSSTPAANDPTEPTTPAENNNTQTTEKPTENNTATTGDGKKGVVTASELNVRESATTESNRVGTLTYGDRITILETSNGWGRTSKGWINLSYVYMDGNTGKNTCKGLVTGTALNVRSGPGTNYDSVNSYKQGTRVNVLEQIKVGNTTWGCTKDGWISMDYIYVDGTEGEGHGTGTVTANAVNIRSGPGTNFEAVSSANSGDELEIFAQFTFGEMTWGCTTKGWISMNYVDMGNG